MTAAALEAEVIAAAIIQPTFDAVRDIFVGRHRQLGIDDTTICRVELFVDPTIHDTKRHFAGTLDTGKRILIAPEAADLPIETSAAIMCHEFGHADDFLFPGRWMFVEQNKPAVWIGDDTWKKKQKKLWRQWLERSDDMIEFCADAIAYAITGKKIGYCGPCLLQCYSGGQPRPKGLR